MLEARAPASADVAVELVVATTEAVTEEPVPVVGRTLMAGEAVEDVSMEGASPEPAAELQVIAPPRGALLGNVP